MVDICCRVCPYNDIYLSVSLTGLGILFPNVPDEVVTFKSIMRTVVQERICVSLANGFGKVPADTRLIKWVLEALEIIQKMVSNHTLHCVIYTIGDFCYNVILSAYHIS